MTLEMSQEKGMLLLESLQPLLLMLGTGDDEFLLDLGLDLGLPRDLASCVWVGVDDGSTMGDALLGPVPVNVDGR